MRKKVIEDIREKISGRDITEREQLEQALRTSFKEWQTTFDAISDAVCLLNREGKVLRCNTAMTNLLRKSSDEIIGRMCWELIHGTSKPVEGCPMIRMLETRRRETMILPINDRWHNISVDPVLDETRDLVGSVHVISDITEQKQTEEALRIKSNAIESSINGVGIADLERRTTYINNSFLKMWGYDENEVIGKPIEIFFDRKEEVLEAIESYKGEGGWIGELKAKRKDGSLFDVELSASVVKDEAGKPICMMASFIDITERKRAEEALRQSEELYRSLVETTDTGYVIIDQVGRVLDANQEYVHLSGHRNLNEICGRSVIEWTADYEKEKNAKAVEKCAKEGYIRNLEIDYVDIHGKVTPIEINATVVKTGGMLRILTLCRDVTKRKRMEEELRRSKEHLQLQINRMPIGCIMWDSKFRVVSWNPAAEEIFGFTEGEALGKHPYGLVVPGDVQTHVNAIWLRLLEGDTTALSVNENMTKDGRIITCAWSNTPLKEADGTVVGVLSMVQDITERKKTEEALQSSEERYRAVVQSANDAIISADSSGNIIFWNKGAQTIFGYSEEDVLGKSITLLMPERYIDAYQKGMERVRTTGKSNAVGKTVELTGLRKNGSEFPLELSLATWKRKEGAFYSAVIRDIRNRKQREREMEAIVTVANALRKASTRAEMLPIILDQLLYLLKAEGAALAMHKPLSDETVFELARGSWANWTSLRLAPGEGVNGYVIKTMQPYVNNDIQSEPRFAIPDLIGGLRGVACIPLIAQGQTIGALWIGCKTDIAEGEVRMLTAIGDIAANAIQRATLHEKTEQHMHRLSALHAIDMAISASFDLRVTLNILLEQVTTQLYADAAAVLLLNPHTQMLEYAADCGFRSRAIQRTRLRLGEGHAGRAALTRRIVSIPNVTESTDTCARGKLLEVDRFIAHHAVPLISKEQVKGVLEIFHRAPLIPDPDWLDFLETLAGQAAIAIDNAELFNNLQRANVELIHAYDTTLEGWVHALDLRDKETHGHSQRVTDMTLKIARAMGVSEAEVVHVRRGALLHDIGKMGVPDSILLKPGPLNDEEWEIMHKHPVYAYELLSPIAFLRPALDIPYYHHEKWDGTGYPQGLKGEHIPLPARIFAVVDVWDALNSERPYRPAWPEEKVKEHLRDQAGKHFDPKVVEAFLSVIAQ